MDLTNLYVTNLYIYYILKLWNFDFYFKIWILRQLVDVVKPDQ